MNPELEKRLRRFILNLRDAAERARLSYALEQDPVKCQRLTARAELLEEMALLMEESFCV